MYLEDKNQTYFRISIPTLVKISAFLPLFGAFFCIVWSVLFDFKSTTGTHCRVPNYLPTISAAIGAKAPQLYVWRICICLHSTPRILVALSYYRFHTSLHVGKRQQLYLLLAALCTALHICENIALICLTYISSTDNAKIHENSFISFMGFSMVYMLLTCVVFGWGRTANGRAMTSTEKKSYQYKIWLFLSNVGSFMLAIYLFFRHNAYCEPGVHGGFAEFDYITVLTNIAFSFTAILDFGDLQLSFSEPNKELSISSQQKKCK